MKLLGWELENYAQIKSQFIPARRGLQLLSGKNNSGKSATLKFLDKTLGTQIQQYSSGSGQPQLLAIAEFDEKDPSPVSAASTGQLIADGAYARLLYNLQTRQVVAGSLYWKQIQGTQFIHNQSVAQMVRTILSESGKAQSTSPIANFPALFPDWGLLQNTLYISPHRQIAPSSTMTRTENVPPEGTSLAAYLQTLQGETRDAFAEIESAFCELFPEFDRLVLRSNQNNVAIHLRLRATKQEIPIVRCGSGLEQALILLAALYQPVYSALLLIDEPHNFLHPDAERKLVRFLANASRHIIAATHSPVIINRVSPDQIISIEAPGTNYEAYLKHAPATSTAPILSAIGFKNSDALFHDRLIFVEGESDAAVFPILLARAGVSRDLISATGFPVIHGLEEMTDPEKVAARLAIYEKLLLSVGGIRQKHIYMLDGDRRNIGPLIEKRVIEGERLEAFFTPGRELENLFLEATVIAAGLCAQGKLSDLSIRADENHITARINHFLSLDTADPKFSKLFPDGRSVGSEPINIVKGSKLLTEIYRDYDLPYEKALSGKLLAENMSHHSDRLKTFVQPMVKLINET